MFDLTEKLTGFLLLLHNVLGMWVILLLLLQVAVLLACIYMRPIRTRRQFFKLVLILFAGLGICSMTVWLIL